MPTCLAAWFEFAEISHITVDDEYHGTAFVGDDGILVCGYIVKELLTASHGFLCRFGLCWCNG
jgi:hypothetical protein